MENMKTLASTVKETLEEDPRTRNSDSFLYLKVLEAIAKQKESPVSLYSMSVPFFLLHMKEYGFPPFESVRRNRQLIQAKYPELAASDPIDAHRLVNEERMLDYVRSAKYEA